MSLLLDLEAGARMVRREEVEALQWLGSGANRGRWSERGDGPGAKIEEKVGGGARVGSLEIRWYV